MARHTYDLKKPMTFKIGVDEREITSLELDSPTGKDAKDLFKMKGYLSGVFSKMINMSKGLGSKEIEDKKSDEKISNEEMVAQLFLMGGIDEAIYDVFTKIIKNSNCVCNGDADFVFGNAIFNKVEFKEIESFMYWYIANFTGILSQMKME